MKVRHKTDGIEIEIAESDFDESIHERIEEGSNAVREMLAGFADVVNKGNEKLLKDLGVGQAQRERVVIGTHEQERNDEGQERDDSDPGREQYERRLEARKRRYAESPVLGRAGAMLSRSDAVLKLPASERAAAVESLLAVGEWAQACLRGDKDQAHQIAVDSWREAGAHGAFIRDMDSGGSSLGALIPVPLESAIVEKRALADKVTPRSMQRMSAGTTLRYPGEGTVLSVTGKAENTTTTQVDATFNDNVLTKKSAGVLAKSSREAADDILASISLANQLSRQAGRAFGTYNNTQAMLGDDTGTNWTGGILDGTNAGTVTATGAATRTIALDMIYDFDPEYWDDSNMVWFMDKTSLKSFADAVDAGGTAIYPNLNIRQAVPVSGDENLSGLGGIEGIPVSVMPAAAMDDSTNANLVVLANMDYFSTLVEPGILVEVTTEGGEAFADHQIHWKFIQRQDGQVDLSAAFKKSSGSISG